MRLSRTRLCALLAGLSLVSTFAVGTSSVHAAPIALGVNTGDAPGRGGAAIDEFSGRVGRTPAIVMWFQDWSEPLFYSSQMPAVDQRGSVPMITWEPTGVPLTEIASGARDDYIRDAARDARSWGKPFFVRFAHEMNGAWYTWGRSVGGNSALTYLRAWRHVVNIFREEGANNVRWVWSPNAAGPGVGGFDDLYPGDAFVDWVGLDGYNWGAHRASGWRSLADIFLPSYQALAALTDKPMMIAETAAPEQGGSKPDWISTGFGRAIPDSMRRVRAVVWFDRNKEADWRVDSSSASLDAFAATARSPEYSLDGARLLRLGLDEEEPPVEQPPLEEPVEQPPLEEPPLEEPPSEEPPGETPPDEEEPPANQLPGDPGPPLRPPSAMSPFAPLPPLSTIDVRPAPARVRLGRLHLTKVHRGVRLAVRLLGAGCGRCVARATVRQGGRVRTVTLRRRGRLLRAIVRGVRRGRATCRIHLRAPSGLTVARTSARAAARG